jgi:DNA-directed RNA polymerase specialized sigma24 family protein
VGVDPDFDRATCERLLAEVGSTADATWKHLAALLWPEVARLVRKSRSMTVLAHSEDHVRNATLLVLEKLGKHDCRAAHLHGPWRAAHPDATLDDWLRIVATNVVRDYVREQSGRVARRSGEGSNEPVSGAAEPVNKRLLHSLATLLPDDDDLPRASALSATSEHAARQLAAWAESRLPREQLAALSAWLQGASFEEMVAELALADAAAAKKLVRAAVASLRRHAVAA